jgi:hypothetical protein
MCDNFPVAWARAAYSSSVWRPPTRVLGVGYAPPPRRPIATLEGFVAALVGCSMARQMPLPPGAAVLLLDVGAQSPVEFDIPPAKMDALFWTGAEQTRGFLKKNV